jgi:hypothetical protein
MEYLSFVMTTVLFEINKTPTLEAEGLTEVKNGEGGIRTLGTVLRFVQQISNLPLSTTQPPLHEVQS